MDKDNDLYYEISELNREVKNLLDAQVGWVKVKGELSSFTPHRTGNLYFTLKDDKGQLEGVVFKNFQRPELLSLKIGDKVYAVGTLTSYIKTGRISFQAFSLSPQGRGTLFDTLQELKAKLEKEGLYLPQKELSLPSMVQKLVIITASHAAALKDILSIIPTRIIGKVEIIVIPSLMQGEKTSSSVIDALEGAKNIEGVQAVLLTRGGGSYEDLWEFNSETLVRFIANYPLPVISAIGHEQDYTLCDYVAHTRYATPSSAAFGLFGYREHIVKHLSYLRARLLEKLLTLVSSTHWRVEKARMKLQDILERRFQNIQNRLDYIYKLLQYLNPTTLLDKGYVLVSKKNGVPFLSEEELQKGDILDIQTQHGVYQTKVIQKYDEESR